MPNFVNPMLHENKAVDMDEGSKELIKTEFSRSQILKRSSTMTKSNIHSFDARIACRDPDDGTTR